MSYKFRHRYRVNPRDPQAFGNCDRCGFTYNHVDLQWQYDYRGNNLQNTNYLVCRKCMDAPDYQMRPPKTLFMPPDPEPIMNPRPRLENIGQPYPFVYPHTDGEYFTDDTGYQP